MNVIRTTIGGFGSSLAPLPSNQGNPPGFFRTVVVEIYYEPDLLTIEEKESIKQKVINPEFVDTMPPNSILGRIVSSNQDTSISTLAIFYPLFSSHISFPLDAGEQVAVIFEDYQQQGNHLGRWVDRFHESSFVEDVNYTHNDRRFDVVNTSIANRSSGSIVPSFANGGGTIGSYTLQPSNNNNPYDEIVRNSSGSLGSNFEPVPRWIKRPNEFVIQSKNNALISIGTDRTGPATRVTGSFQKDQFPYAGTIDIVCGRGRGNIPYVENQEPDPENEKLSTSPFPIRNSRRNLETDKIPARRNKRRNFKEGNPNFRRDAARFYISMNTLGDDNFKTGHSTDTTKGFEYPENTTHPIQKPTVPGGIGNSYGILKADNVRIIGRKETNPEIKGSILLLREGTKEEDLSFVYLEEGKVQVEAKKIYFGKAGQELEPYIKWTVYNDQINELKRQINALADQVQSMSTQYASAFIASQTIPFSPVASLVAVGNSLPPTLNTNITNIKTAINNIDPNAAKSNKLFGE